MPVLHRVVPVTVYGAAPPSQADSVPIPVVSPSIVAAQSVAPFTVMRAFLRHGPVRPDHPKRMTLICCEFSSKVHRCNCLCGAYTQHSVLASTMAMERSGSNGKEAQKEVTCSTGIGTGR
jgi:hypothetical protein